MPYAIANPVNGESVYTPPTTYRYVEDASQMNPGEFLLAEEQMNPEWVWDSATSSTRPPTQTDMLNTAKRRAKERVEIGAVNDMQSILHVYRAVAVMARNNADPRLGRIKEKDDKLAEKLTRINNASTVEEANAINWEG